MLGKFIASCPKLISFRFALDKRPPSKTPLASQSLQSLQNLKNLQTVNIDCLDNLTLLKEFILPPTIQNIRLDFRSDKVFNELGDENFFQIFLTFCDKWSHFIMLETLEILFFQSACSHHPLNLEFLMYWLKKIQNVKNLSIGLSRDYGNSTGISMQGNFDFPAFLESIQHYKNTLRSLKISDHQRIYSLNSPPHQFVSFPCLQKLFLRGEIPQGFEEYKFFHINLRDLITKQTEKPLEIILEGLKFNSFESLWKFIEIFSQNKSQKRALKIELIVYINKKLGRFYYPKDAQIFELRRGSLSIKITVSCDDLAFSPSDFELMLKKVLKLQNWQEIYLRGLTYLIHFVTAYQ